MAAKKASKRKSGRKFLLVGKDTPFQYQEAFKSLRTNLKFLAVGKACKKIIMTSAIPGEGKSQRGYQFSSISCRDGEPCAAG